MASNTPGMTAPARRQRLLRVLLGGALLIAAVLAVAAIGTLTLGPEDARLGLTDPNKATATVEAKVHRADHSFGTVSTTVEAGKPAHLWVQVLGGPRGLRPSGSVSVSWYPTANCTGTPSTSSMALVGGIADSTVGHVAPHAGTYSFRAVYSGDFNYNWRFGPCVTYNSG